MSEEIKFENPTDLLEKVKSHGGKVFETMSCWPSFDPDNNIRILEEVIEYVERYNQQVFSVDWDGPTNIPESGNLFTLPRNVKLNVKSVRWFHETTLEGLNEDLAITRRIKNLYTREDGTHTLEAAKNQVKKLIEEVDEISVDPTVYQVLSTLNFKEKLEKILQILEVDV